MTKDTQDNLEKFIKNHREEFDSLTPREAIWENIHKDLDARNGQSNYFILWKVAAVILFMFSLGLMVFINKDYFDSNEVVYDSEFLTTESYYASVINERQQTIKIVAQNFPDIEHDFESDWVGLDQNYKQLKKEYEKNQSEEIRNALVQNLRARVSLLNRQIEVLGQIKNTKNNILKI